MGKIFNKGLSKEDKKEGVLKRLENIKDKNNELLNTFNTTNKASKNKINIQRKNLIYDHKHSFVKYKDIDGIKELSLDSMYKKLCKVNDEIIGLIVLSNAKNLYNELYYFYKEKYNKEINSLDTKNRTKLDYKKLRLIDDYEYPSEEGEEKVITDLNAFKE